MTRRSTNAPRRLAARVDAKGRITLPKPLRTRLGLTPGTVVLLNVEGEALMAMTGSSLIRRLSAARQALQKRLRDG